MRYLLFDFDGLSGLKSLNLELVQTIFGYQKTHACKIGILTHSSRQFVNQILNQTNLKLEFDFILSLETNLTAAAKFIYAAKFWDVDLVDLYYFTTTLAQVKQSTLLNPEKVFGCCWNDGSIKSQMLEYMPQTRVLSNPNQVALVLPPDCAELVENSNFLASLQAWADLDGCQVVVGAVVINTAGQVLIQKRSSSRRLFPNCWDISAGGHLEKNETIFQALRRELHEETGLELAQILELILIYDWKTEINPILADQNPRRREFDFVITCKGDLNHIRIEKDKVSEIRWIGVDELDLLKQDHTNGNFVYRLVSKALEYNRDNI